MYKDEDSYDDILPEDNDDLFSDKKQSFEDDAVMENQVSVDEFSGDSIMNLEIEKEVTKKIEENHKDFDSVKEEILPTKSEPQNNSYYSQKVNVKNNKKTSSFKKFITACVVVSLFGGAGIGASYSAMENLVFNKGTEATSLNEDGQSELNPDENGTNNKTSNGQAMSKTDDGMTAVEVIDKVFPSVVNINMNVSGTTNYYGFQVPYEGSGSGSGVIFNVDDEFVYIVTNNHVVNQATEINVSITGSEMIKASVVGSEAASDIAVIKASIADFNEAGIQDIVVAEFGDSDNLKVGESTIAIGNALGEGKSATGGMISILDKSIEVSGVGLEVIQTSSPINEGNSGGALVNYAGEVIGINTAKSNVSTAEAMGYAIPSNNVKEIMNRLLVDGTTPKAYIGIVGSDITEELSDMYKLPVGVLVRQVYDGGGAQMAGIQEGDIIISFADKTIMNMESLLNVLKEQEIGSTVKIGILRNAENPMTLDIKIFDANNLS